MEKIWLWLQISFAALGGWLGVLLGGLDGLLYVLITFAVIDYISGVMCAVAEKKLSSEVGFRGICKKILIFAVIALAHMLDAHIIGTIGVVGEYSAIRSAAIFFYLSNEGVSLLENITRLGLPVPDKLKAILAQLHGKGEPK